MLGPEMMFNIRAAWHPEPKMPAQQVQQATSPEPKAEATGGSTRKASGCAPGFEGKLMPIIVPLAVPHTESISPALALICEPSDPKSQQ